MLPDDLNFATGCWTNLQNPQVDTSDLSNSTLSHINYDLDIEALATSSNGGTWLVNDGCCISRSKPRFPRRRRRSTHPEHGILSSSILSNISYFSLSNASTNLTPVPQSAQVDLSLSVPEQKEPACSRCWKLKKKVRVLMLFYTH